MTITLTNEASAKLLGISPALYNPSLQRLTAAIQAAHAEMRFWQELYEAEDDDRYWRLYERFEQEAAERWSMLIDTRKNLIAELEAFLSESIPDKQPTAEGD